MGMFDHIKLDEEIHCPVCEVVLSGWQSKDGDCVFNTVEYWNVNNFYTSCTKCGAFIEYTLQEE